MSETESTLAEVKGEELNNELDFVCLLRFFLFSTGGAHSSHSTMSHPLSVRSLFQRHPLHPIPHHYSNHFSRKGCVFPAAILSSLSFLLSPFRTTLTHSLHSLPLSALFLVVVDTCFPPLSLFQLANTAQSPTLPTLSHFLSLFCLLILLVSSFSALSRFDCTIQRNASPSFFLSAFAHTYAHTHTPLRKLCHR